MSQKDLFSTQADLYAAFRPAYPEELYTFIFQHVASRDVAWDCATGNGQVAQYLSKHFTSVYATDISQKQLDHAYKADNIYYSISPAEKTSFSENQFDLVTVAQAFHWFDHDAFFREVKRVAKPKALLAIWGYNLLSISPEIDQIIQAYYTDVVGPYWDSARRILEKEYKDIPVPFQEIGGETFDYKIDWNLDHLEGYLNTWSSTQQYIKTNGNNPVPTAVDEIKKYWTAEKVTVRFPIFIRLFRI